MAIVGRFLADFSNFQAAVQKAEVSLKGLETGAGKVGTSLNRMVDQFSGRKLIQDAALAAEAVERIGGATKLTEKEQASLNALLTEGLAKYKAMGLEAPKNMVDLANATKKAGLETDALKAKTDTLKPSADAGALSFKSLFGAFSLANIAGQAVNFVTAEVGKFIEAGGKLPAIQQSFSKLTAGIGQNSQEMLTALRTGTRGMVSELDLMQSSNKAILLGLPVTAKSMGELSSAATALGKAMGQDATKSLDDLITALGRSSPLILDNLGLTVKVGEANEAYAAKLRKSVNDLTDAEKKMAFYEAAMEAARAKTQELGDQTKTFGDIAQTAWTKVTDVVTRGVADMNTSLGSALSSWQNFLRSLQLGPGGVAFAAQMGAAEDRAKDLDKTLKQSILAKPPAGFGKLPGLDIAVMSLEEVQAVERELNQQLEKSDRAWKQAAKVRGDAMDEAARRGVAAYKDFHRQLEAVDAMITQAISPQGRAAMQASATKAEAARLLPLKESVSDVIATLKAGEKAQDFFAKISDDMVKFGDVASGSSKVFKQSVTENIIGTVERIPQMFVQGFTGGGGFLGALKAIGVQIADALTQPLIARLGGALANLFLGGKGSTGLAGSLLGGVAGPALGGLFGAGAGAGAAVFANTSAAVTGGVGATAGTAAGIGGALALTAATAGIGATPVGVYFLARGNRQRVLRAAR